MMKSVQDLRSKATADLIPEYELLDCGSSVLARGITAPTAEEAWSQCACLEIAIPRATRPSMINLKSLSDPMGARRAAMYRSGAIKL